MTQWVIVCEQETQPTFGSGPAWDCPQLNHRYVTTDTLVKDSAPFSSFGQLAAMTPDEGLAIGSAVGVVWAIAFGVRAIARTFFDPDRGNEYD